LQFCDKEDSNAPAVYRCNPDTGRDESTLPGICRSLCKQPTIQSRLRRLNQTFSDVEFCSDPGTGPSTSDCPSGFACYEAPDSCVKPGTDDCTVSEDGEVTVSRSSCLCAGTAD
ncbi:hypothetical protein DUNSADRAFT_18289, partial [Dunaliella salina]